MFSQRASHPSYYQVFSFEYDGIEKYADKEIVCLSYKDNKLRLHYLSKKTLDPDNPHRSFVAVNLLALPQNMQITTAALAKDGRILTIVYTHAEKTYCASSYLNSKQYPTMSSGGWCIYPTMSPGGWCIYPTMSPGGWCISPLNIAGLVSGLAFLTKSPSERPLVVISGQSSLHIINVLTQQKLNLNTGLDRILKIAVEPVSNYIYLLTNEAIYQLSIESILKLPDLSSIAHHLIPIVKFGEKFQAKDNTQPCALAVSYDILACSLYGTTVIYKHYPQQLGIRAIKPRAVYSVNLGVSAISCKLQSTHVTQITEWSIQGALVLAGFIHKPSNEQVFVSINGTKTSKNFADKIRVTNNTEEINGMERAWDPDVKQIYHFYSAPSRGILWNCYNFTEELDPVFRTQLLNLE